MKTSKMIKTVYVTLLAVSIHVLAVAQQQFKYSAAVDKIDSAGFYRIAIDPAFIAASNADLSDIRIINSKNKFVPYIFGDKLKSSFRVYINFPQVSNPKVRDSLTAFTIQNVDAKSIDHLWVRMRNTAVTRTVNILGSEDNDNWFAIKENVLLKETDADTRGNYEQQLDFPPSTYKYFKIQVNGKNATPISILSAGIYSQTPEITGYDMLKGLTYIQKDSGNISYVTVRFPAAYQVNKLELGVSGAKFFKREVDVYEVNHKSTTLLTSSIISSDAGTGITLNGRAKTLVLQINNHDNAPLKISGITAFQDAISLVGYLDKNENYTLLVGDKNAVAPNYDLALFANSIQSDPDKISHGPITNNKLLAVSKPKPDAIPKWSIWVAAIIALGALLWLTLKMAKEVSKQPKS